MCVVVVVEEEEQEEEEEEEECCGAGVVCEVGEVGGKGVSRLAPLLMSGGLEEVVGGKDEKKSPYRYVQYMWS